MAAIPSVVIGLGTTGGMIVTQVYQQYRQYCEETGDNPDTVQFLLLDTDEAVAGARDLAARGDFVQAGMSDAEAVRIALAERDPFFARWWDPEFTDIGPAYPGAGTIPMKGRLAFWGNVGSPFRGAGDSFGDMYFDRLTDATATQPERTVASAIVIIVTSLCGGTGAGCFMDVAEIIEERTPTGTQVELHGIYLLPEVMEIVAPRDKHERLAANGYASLMSLNYWQMRKGDRPRDIGDFMRVGGSYGQQDVPPYVLSGDQVPIDVAWLVGRHNRSGNAMIAHRDYLSMCSTAIAALTFQERAQTVRGLMNDFITAVNAPEPSGQPQRYGSVAARSLRFSREEALRALSHMLGIRASGALRCDSEVGSGWAISQATGFLNDHQLWESDVEGRQGRKVNQLLEQLADLEKSPLEPYARLSQYVSHLQRDDLNTVVISTLSRANVTEARAREAVHGMVADAKRQLAAELEGVPGVSYARILADNRRALLEEVKDNESDDARALGLHQRVENILADGEHGVARCQAFVQQLERLCKMQRKTLQHELAGEPETGTMGDEWLLERLEEKLESEIDTLRSDLGGFSINPARQKRMAAKRFQDRWWNAWLAKMVLVMKKREAVSFYESLELELARLSRLMTDMSARLSSWEESLTSELQGMYGRQTRADTVLLEENALTSQDALRSAFGEELANARESCCIAVGSCLARRVRPASDEQEHEVNNLWPEVAQVMEDQAQGAFGQRLNSMTLWDALAIDSREEDPASIHRYVQGRINTLIAQCRPFWSVGPELQVGGGLASRLEVVAYDSDAKEQFEARLGQGELQLRPSTRGGAVPAGDHVSVDAFEPSELELNVLAMEGGVPLDWLEGIDDNQVSFKREYYGRGWHSLRDHRFEELIENVGLPLWEIESGREAGEEGYLLLMAEHLGLLETPLTKELRTSGYHRLGAALGSLQADYALDSSSRLDVFSILRERGSQQELFDEIRQQIDQKRRSMGADEWRNENLVCYGRLREVMNRTPRGEVRDLLREQVELMEQILQREFGLDRGEANRLIEEEGLAEEWEVEDN